MEDSGGEEITSSTRLLKRPHGKEKRNGGTKCYQSLMVVVFFVMFLISVVSLGSFGVMQHKVSKFWDIPDLNVHYNTCILFGSYNRTDPDGTVHINLSTIGSCAFTLWGLMSVMLVMFIWLIYSFVLIFCGPKV